MMSTLETTVNPTPFACAASAMTQAEREGLLLIAALAEDLSASKSLASNWGTQFDRSWSAIDLVLQRRRQATNDHQLMDLVTRIDRALGQAWGLSALRVVGGDLSFGPVLHRLGVITRRVPAPAVVGGLVQAMCNSAAKLAQGAKVVAFEDGLLARNECLKSNMVPTWFQVLDWVTRSEMVSVMRWPSLLGQDEYFAGLVWSWRFGLPRAADYVSALAEVFSHPTQTLSFMGIDGQPIELALPRRLFINQPNGAQVLSEVIGLASMSQTPQGLQRGLIEQIFRQLRDTPAIAGWVQVLAEAMVNLPNLLTMVYEPTDSAVDTASQGDADWQARAERAREAAEGDSESA